MVFIFCYTFYFTFLLAMIVELLPTLITLGTKITLKCPDLSSSWQQRLTYQGMHEWNVLPVSTRNSTSLDLFQRLVKTILSNCIILSTLSQNFIVFEYFFNFFRYKIFFRYCIIYNFYFGRAICDQNSVKTDMI